MANYDGILVCPAVRINHAQSRLPVTREEEEEEEEHGGDGQLRNNPGSNLRQYLNAQQSCQAVDKGELDMGGISEEDEFWLTIGSLKTSFFGVSMWCMGWNLVAIFLAPQSCWQFLPVLFLGFMFSLSGCHTHRISRSRRYKSLFSLIPICLIYVMSGLSIMQRSIANALESITYNNDFTEFAYNGKTETFMSIGNLVLMCFVCYCNVHILKLISERVGAWFDAFDKSDKKQEGSQC